jgi:hypothetical protein
MTSRGKRNPAKPDLGGGTRRWRRRIGSACLKLPSTNATAPTVLPTSRGRRPNGAYFDPTGIRIDWKTH